MGPSGSGSSGRLRALPLEANVSGRQAISAPCAAAASMASSAWSRFYSYAASAEAAAGGCGVEQAAMVTGLKTGLDEGLSRASMVARAASVP